MKPSDPGAAKLLRWYPRPWRERYGEEFLAMVEDSLDGERPGLRFRLSVARTGLRERGHRVRLAGQWAALPVLRALTGRWWTFFVAGYVFAILPYEFKAPSGAVQGWRVTAALAALAAVAVLGSVGVLVSGLPSGRGCCSRPPSGSGPTRPRPPPGISTSPSGSGPARCCWLQ